MATSVRQRVQRRRDTLRAAGLRPVQIWIPDTRRPGFAEECRRQASVVAAADASDRDLQSFMDAAWDDLFGPDNEAR
ncbi:antitoxin MazE family protein [Starkeya koreensis]|uniref:Antitoxin MazE family protein n=1 Tax=Ancylobacter koreensis TaxID=266121 RepID=A0ABT0DLR7_9HYPH|nr:antitoxin MazE family protein [Ancylobacter koreensis]MCK0208226.1 antitoxin MazE family protein [Ancylobacter koreensis]